MSATRFGDWDPLLGITAPGGPHTMAYANDGIVEFYMPGEWSGRLTPTEARTWIDALHTAVHAAADAADTQVVSGTSVPEPSWCDLTTEPNVEV